MASELIKQCMSKGFLLDKEVVGKLEGIGSGEINELIDLISFLGIKERVINLKSLLDHKEKIVSFFKGKEVSEPLRNFINFFYSLCVEVGGKSGEEKTGLVKLLQAPTFKQRKIEVADFVQHFRSRFESMKKILESKDFDDLTSLRKIEGSGNYTIIVSIFDKRVTKNKNIVFEVEDDLTGKRVVVANRNRKEVFEAAKSVLLDDVVAMKVSGSSEILFANEIIYPEASLSEKRHSDFDEYVAFVSDFHAGSTMFLEKNLLRFVKWLNVEEGTKAQREIAKKVKYLFIVGDNIDGINHYPGQEKYLEAFTSHDQYERVSRVLKLVRRDIQMVMCPGQHDSVWVGEPQPVISEKWAPSLYEIPNLYLVPNPALVEIDGGFKILMYHGASINSFIDEMPEIRTKYGHRRPTLVVKEFLKRRHLAPMHGMMDYIPCEKDSLVIENVPDIIVTGDQHRVEVTNYNNILLIASSCWQSITPFEERVGNVPDPCKVPLFNLKTREIKILDFSGEKEEISDESQLKECDLEDGC